MNMYLLEDRRLVSPQEFLKFNIRRNTFVIMQYHLSIPAKYHGAINFRVPAGAGSGEVPIGSGSRSHWETVEWLDPYPSQRQEILEAIDQRDPIKQIVVVGSVPLTDSSHDLEIVVVTLP